MTNAAFGFGDERFAERGSGKTVIDLHPGAAVFHFTGRRRFERYAEIVQPAGTGETGIERGIENIVTASQKLFHMLNGQALQKILRSYAGPGREEPMEMEWTEPGRRRELVQIGLVYVMSIQEPDHVCDSFVIVHARVCNRQEFAATRFLLRSLIFSESSRLVNSLCE